MRRIGLVDGLTPGSGARARGQRALGRAQASYHVPCLSACSPGQKRSTPMTFPLPRCTTLPFGYGREMGAVSVCPDDTGDTDEDAASSFVRWCSKRSPTIDPIVRIGAIATRGFPCSGHCRPCARGPLAIGQQGRRVVRLPTTALECCGRGPGGAAAPARDEGTSPDGCGRVDLVADQALPTSGRREAGIEARPSRPSTFQRSRPESPCNGGCRQMRRSLAVNIVRCR